MKSFFCIILILVFTILFVSYASAENFAADDDPLVKINILSKHVRFLREGKLNQIVLILSNDAIISDDLNNEPLKDGKIIFYFADGKYHAVIDSIEQKAPFHYNISCTKTGSICTIKLDEEQRQYPLPFAAVCDGSGLRFYTWERLNTYIVDSSCAEYGSSFWKYKEAILALAHIIRARYFYQDTHRHKDSDFCDLTHCQVYRGRLGSGIKFNDEWIIDPKKLPHDLFFHANCGGRTLDIRAFNSRGGASIQPAFNGIQDWLYRTGTRLCQDNDSDWERSISADELSAILFNKSPADIELAYDLDKEQVAIHSQTGYVLFSPESFRLKINRVKGWSFLKSNNYSVSEEIINNKKLFIFNGKGLGHGIGLCQHGAAALSSMGYNRYEILEHYFPGIELISMNKSDAYSPYLSFCIFNIYTGSIQTIQTPELVNRSVPPGSIFKLIVSIYLARERQDLFNSYSYTCTGKSDDPAMPERCWKLKGHGIMHLPEAISNSCNYYFSSLYNKISFDDFKSSFKKFCAAACINADLPDTANSKEWSGLLAGLDYRISFSVKDYIRLVQILNISGFNNDNKMSQIIPLEQKKIIFKALQASFTKGTASGKVKPYGSPYNYIQLDRRTRQIENNIQQSDFWGKTATILDGTNRPVSYGLFIGGLGNTGIVVVLRKGNGHLAAKWAEVLLCYLSF